MNQSLLSPPASPRRATPTSGDRPESWTLRTARSRRVRPTALGPHLLTANLNQSATLDAVPARMMEDPDEQTTTSIRHALLADPTLADHIRSLHILTVRAGTLLRGNVASRKVHDHIVRVVQSAGVRRIHDELHWPTSVTQD